MPPRASLNPIAPVPAASAPARNTLLYDVSIYVNEGWMTRDAARVVPELIRQAVAELKTKLMLVAAENAVTITGTITDRNVQRNFDLAGPEEDVR